MLKQEVVVFAVASTVGVVTAAPQVRDVAFLLFTTLVVASVSVLYVTKQQLVAVVAEHSSS